ncbi:MAG: aminotransferase class V-fold PLP-dependent enzyme [Planctomycetes bacterium]|nr:aminotransferase class V-fold PLP-dependent enzyme [Planctomycetota bacterium]
MDWDAVRDEFPVTRNYNFQNHAGIAPVCRPAAEAARTYLRHAEENAYIKGGFHRHADHVRQSAAKLINANPDEVTFIKNTSEGLSMVANGLSWKSGDNVVISKAEFPANVYPWQALRSRGVEVRMAIEEDGRIPLDQLIGLIDSRTRLVAVSSVQFASGFRTDLASLGEFCQSKGVFLCVDAIQSLGVLPVDVSAMKIDFLAADGHKWLCAPEGCGLFYVRKELQGHLRPTSIGWMSMKCAHDYGRAQFEFFDDIRRFDSGSYNLMGIYALGGAIDMFLEIGIEHIAARVMSLTDRLVTGVRDKGYRVVSSRQAGEGSGIVALISDSHDHDEIQRHLQAEHRIVIAVRNGRLRISPHIYNTIKEIDRLIEVLPTN